MVERLNSRDGESRDSKKGYLADIGKTPLLSAEDEVELAKRIEAGEFAADILAHPEVYEGANRPDVTLEELEELMEIGAMAKEHMMEANLRLVVSVAKKYHYRATPGMRFFDMIQEGNLGLHHAVEKFDYTKGYKFSTYATWWIRQRILRGIANQARTVRLPMHKVEAIKVLRGVERRLQRDLRRAPTLEEIAEEADRPVEQVRDLFELDQEIISYNILLGGDENSSELLEVLGVPTDTVETSVIHAESSRELRDTLTSALEEERSVDILLRRYGVIDGRPWSREDIARHHKLSVERVRQLERDAKDEFRKYCDKNGITPEDLVS